jgi:hypothetical protein
LVRAQCRNLLLGAGLVDDDGALVSAHVEAPEIPDADAWPFVELKRQPNGHLGVMVTFPLPPPVAAEVGIDSFSMNMEPKRAKRLCEQLVAHLKELGFE